MAPVMEGKAADAGDIKPFFHLLVFDDTQVKHDEDAPPADAA